MIIGGVLVKKTQERISYRFVGKRCNLKHVTNLDQYDRWRTMLPPQVLMQISRQVNEEVKP